MSTRNSYVHFPFLWLTSAKAGEGYLSVPKYMSECWGVCQDGRQCIFVEGKVRMEWSCWCQSVLERGPTGVSCGQRKTQLKKRRERDQRRQRILLNTEEKRLECTHLYPLPELVLPVSDLFSSCINENKDMFMLLSHISCSGATKVL